MLKALAGLMLLFAAQAAYAQPGDWDIDHGRHRHGGGARVLVLRNYHLQAGDTTHGPVVVIGGRATIDGHADDNVVVLGGSLRVGPQAVIDGDLVTVGGEAFVDPQARVYGDVNKTVVRWPDVDGRWDPMPRRWLAGVALAATILRLLIVFFVAAMLAAVAPGWVRGIAARVGAAPAVSAVTGVACQIAFVPVLIVVIVALAVSVIGIPLLGALPFVIAGAGVAGTAGFTAVAARIGAHLRGTTVEASRALVADVLLGFGAVSLVTIVASVLAFGPFWTSPLILSVGAVGMLIEYLAWTIGIGAATASMLTRWTGPAPAAGVPPIAPAPTTI
jgi:hypothetical protein